MSEDLKPAAAKSPAAAATPASGRALAWLVKAAGRFRPTSGLAKRALPVLRRRRLVPRFVSGRLNGRPLLLDLDEDVDAKVFLYGAYDERGLKLIRLVMQAVKCRTALDIGANIGNHTAYFSDWAQRVYAFEPNPPVFDRLQALVVGAGLTNVTAFPYGLSDHEGELPYFVFPGQAHLTTFAPTAGGVASGRARVTRGDEFIEEAGVRDVDVIKIDVEEHEFEVLSGLRKTLARDRPVLFMEFKESAADKFGGLAGFLSFLDGYRIFGTQRGLASTLFKTALRLEPFVEGKYYAHVVCVPERHMTELRALGLEAR
jgi:FkbM family methyltransferase